ncbi:terminase small subunit [Myxococcus virescens]|uniref:terminase small subunit n=1 Tax=Myxococcus virescens TaxID=83456 RepID=UPI0014288B52|nr:terminase small subunit [Myxococcus virescens]
MRKRKGKRGGRQGAGTGRLTGRQRAFVEHYLVRPVASEAAKKAGYAEGSAEVAGSRLLRNAKVAKFLATAQKERLERLKASADEVVVEASRIGLADPRRAFDASGMLLPIQDIPEDIARCISSIEVEALFSGKGEDKVQIGTLTKVKFWPKDRALDLLARHHGLDKPQAMKLEVSGPGGGPIATTDARDLEGYTDAELDQLEAIERARESRRAAAVAGSDSDREAASSPETS